MKKTNKDFNKEEISKIIKNTFNLKHRFILELDYGAWLRASEIVQLKVQNLNLDYLKLHIKNTKWFQS